MSLNPSYFTKGNWICHAMFWKSEIIELRSAVLRFGPARGNIMHSLIVFIKCLILDMLIEYDNVRFKQWKAQCTHKTKGYCLDITTCSRFILPAIDLTFFNCNCNIH